MRLGLACCTLWEVWKWRNSVRYGDERPNLAAKLQQWSRDLRVLISSKFHSQVPARPRPTSCHFASELEDRHCFVSSDLIYRGGKVFGAAIFKPKNARRWSVFSCTVPDGDGLSELFHFLGKIISVGRLNGLLIKQIKCSNPFMEWLNPAEEEVPWNELCRVRVFRAKFKNICFSRVCPRSNIAAHAVAEALAQNRVPLLQVSFVRQALASERLGSALCCAVRTCDYQPVALAFPLAAQDDGSGRPSGGPSG